MSFLDNLPKPFFVLAPLDDVTDTVFRQIIAGLYEKPIGKTLGRPDVFFTEFVNVDGLQSPGREKLLHKLKFTNKEHPLIAQFWGKNPDNFYKTAQDAINMGFAGFDLNMGCPDKAVCNNGCCSALINDRELAKQIIDASREGLNGKLPLSVKTRIGYNQIDLSWVEFLLKQKLNMLTIHARTKKEMSKVPNHFEVYDDIVKMRDKIAPDTLLIANGDILNRAHGEQVAKKYGVDGVMIGRGVFSDPFAFSDNSPWASWTKEQKIELFKKHVQLFANTWQNNERKVVTLNKFCKIYINGFDGAKELREKLMQSKNTDELLKMISTA